MSLVEREAGNSGKGAGTDAAARYVPLPSPSLEFPQRMIAPKCFYDVAVIRAQVATLRNVDAEAVSIYKF